MFPSRKGEIEIFCQTSARNVERVENANITVLIKLVNKIYLFVIMVNPV